NKGSASGINLPVARGGVVPASQTGVPPYIRLQRHSSTDRQRGRSRYSQCPPVSNLIRVPVPIQKPLLPTRPFGGFVCFKFLNQPGDRPNSPLPPCSDGLRLPAIHRSEAIAR